MSTKSLLSVALVIVVLGIVWKFVAFAFKYAIIGAVIYVIYILFFAGKTSAKE